MVSVANNEQLFPSLRRHCRYPTSEARNVATESLCIVLHGHGMEAQEMQDWLASPICANFPATQFVFLQAPSKWHSGSSMFLPSWFSYIEEFAGEREDVIDAAHCHGSACALRGIIHSLAQRSAPSKIVCLGLIPKSAALSWPLELSTNMKRPNQIPAAS